MNEIVTIIVPVYNVENYLQRCIDSLLNQTYKKLEIILVNDGSLDNSSDICDRYAKEDSRVKVIHKENGGLSDARNAGLKEATGDYIVFIDSDDYAEINMVEETLKLAKSNNSEVVIYGYFTDIVDSNEELIDSIPVIPNSGAYNSTNFSSIKVEGNLTNLLGYAWNKMYKSELILETNFEFNKGISLVEDILFNVPILKKADNVSFLNKAYIHYMQRDEDTLGKKLYGNYSELKYMSANAIKDLMKYWGKTDNEINHIYNLLIFNSIKNLLVTLGNNKSLSINEKEKYFDSMIEYNNMRDVLTNIKTKSRKDQIVKRLLLNKNYKMVLISYQLKLKFF